VLELGRLPSLREGRFTLENTCIENLRLKHGKVTIGASALVSNPEIYRTVLVQRLLLRHGLMCFNFRNLLQCLCRQLFFLLFLPNILAEVEVELVGEIRLFDFVFGYEIVLVG